MLAIGVSPASLSYEKVLRGGVSQREFYISNAANETRFFKYNATGCDFLRFSFDPQSPLEIPANSQKRVVAIANPTNDTANGIYECMIRVEETGTVTAREGGAVVGIFPAIGLRTAVEVTGEQVIGSRVYKMYVLDNEVGRPIKFTVGIANTGNVRVYPRIIIKIYKGTLVDTVEKIFDSIIPGEYRDLVVEWNTEGRDVGNYTATVQVFIDDTKIEDKELRFRIFEKGTLTKRGEIVSINVTPGETTKIEVLFRNVGESDVEARIKAELHLGGQLIDVAEGDNVFVKVGATEKLVAYYKPTKNGDYTIKGKVVYDGKYTEFEKTFTFGAAAPTGLVVGDASSVSIGLLVVIIIILLYVLLKRRPKKK
ncbi:MAG: hypothetical protein HZB67_04485 [Candidatus Aenigmarchaeota archaeon]|nr:hypothetical protein [Candidatus Aenigmarchaeota archaeon]